MRGAVNMPQKKRGQTPVEEAVARILNALDVPEKTEEIPLLPVAV